LDTNNLDQLRIERSSAAEKRNQPWLVVFAVLAVILAAGGWWWLKTPAAIEIRSVAAKKIESNAVATVLNASGYVTARRQATVSSKVTGKVTEVLIEEGMKVEKGQVLARLDDSNALADFRLAEAKLGSVESAREETKALLIEARLALDRAIKVRDEKLISQAELDTARANKDSLQARLTRQQADVRVSERDLDVLRQRLDDTVIKAPFSGVVVAKNAQPGEMISPLSSGGFTRTGIGTIVDMSSLEIEVDVNETYINRVVPGQPVEATLDAYPQWKIPARVIAIIPTADRQRATVAVRIGFQKLDPRILPDMGVKVAFQQSGATASASASIVIPEKAVRNDNGRDIVLVVANGSIERRAISVKGQFGSDVHVAAGLKQGEKVVIEGPPDLREGDMVVEAN